MGEPRPFASLGPMLLARKGTAKPAMRVQLQQSDRMAELSDELDELSVSQSALGWNDMGDDGDQAGSVVALPVANDRAARVAAHPSAGQSTGQARDRVAFTLRLDAERHLKLRIASTMQDCSAQALVTEALDRFLSTIPELETIAAEMRRTADKA